MTDVPVRMPPARQLDEQRQLAEAKRDISADELGEYANVAIERVATEVGRHLTHVRHQLDELDQSIVGTAATAQNAIRTHLRIARAAADAGDLIALRLAELHAMLKDGT